MNVHVERRMRRRVVVENRIEQGASVDDDLHMREIALHLPIANGSVLWGDKEFDRAPIAIGAGTAGAIDVTWLATGCPARTTVTGSDETRIELSIPLRTVTLAAPEAASG